MTNLELTTQKTREAAETMIAELENAIAQRLVRTRRSTEYDDESRTLIAIPNSGGTASTFPSWFGSIGRTRVDVLKNLNKIAGGKACKNKLAERILELIDDLLAHGQMTIDGFIPPDLDYVQSTEHGNYKEGSLATSRTGE